ncbi:TolC family protein [Pseudomonas sp. MAG002Y]|uniref:TolC family protein n=1 Tax=Pseudomonas sp. MAG002Y TaxID=2678690 RepID=UPI001C60E8AD|nr:TolC family protein [Pseudomonas sp. MAG002Y]MBW5415825.1 TolC family protein [Pseudomonas sp. MAG002Y]
MAIQRTTPQPFGKTLKHIVLVALLGMGLTACAVKPVPADFDAEALSFKAKLDAIIESEEPVNGPISLYDAMARALKYNLDQKIELMDEVFKEKQLDLSNAAMLPNIAATFGYSGRNNEAGSSSRSLLSGRQSLEPSTSSEKQVNTADLSASWDVLDFGLSYFRAKQQADEKLISAEHRRKVINRILEDVRTAYWRAVSADRNYKKLVDLEGLAQKALMQTEQLEARRLVPPLTVLSYQRDLLQVQNSVQKLQRELALAKNQLAALINLKPDTRFTLILPDRTDVVPELPGSASEMVITGLRFRSEMHESLYRRRINANELNAALIKAFPSVKAVLGLNYDSNKYLTDNEWLSYSSQVSWNLMSLIRYPRQRDAIKAEGQVIEQRELALTMAIMTQVHVARVRFIRFSQELGTIRKAQQVQDNILKLSRGGFKAHTVSQQDLVREEMNSILAEVSYDAAYADVQNAYANLYASMGLDNFDINIDAHTSVAIIAAQLKEHWIEHASTLPPLPEKPEEPEEHS